MAAFALSCFGLLLFLWLSFGGPVPLKPKGYRVNVAFPEATNLGLEADVRVAGVSVGKVRKKSLGDNRTDVVIELDRRFAPLAADAKAMLRQKTLLGETYVELTPGTGEEKIREGGRLPDGQVGEAVELDEIFQALDPDTRESFKTWQKDLAASIEGRGRDFNDALGTLPGFAKDGGDIMEVLDTQERAVSSLVRNTGVVFGALSENESQLRNLITGAGRMFDATASRDEALAETIRIFPTFLDESKATLERAQRFAVDTRPLVRDLRPVARDLKPTLRDVRGLAPDLEKTFTDLDPLIDASKEGLPATAETLRGLTPLLASAGEFLGEFNPILQYLEFSQYQVSDFLHNGAAAIADTTVSPSGGMGHYLRQIGVFGSESLAIYPERQASNRGNTYFKPGELNPTALQAKYQMFGNWDCKPSGGEVEGNDEENRLGCWVAPNMTFKNKLQGRFPHVEAEDYSK